MSETPESKASPQEPPGDAGRGTIGTRWLELCQGAEQLEDAVHRFAQGQEEDPGKAAISYLESVLEAFPMPEDPSREVHAYAVHKLAYSVYEAVVAGSS